MTCGAAEAVRRGDAFEGGVRWAEGIVPERRAMIDDAVGAEAVAGALADVEVLAGYEQRQPGRTRIPESEPSDHPAEGGLAEARDIDPEELVRIAGHRRHRRPSLLALLPMREPPLGEKEEPVPQ